MLLRKASNKLRCSFCGKSEKEISKLIAGPNVYICNECVGICNQFIADDQQLGVAAHTPEDVSVGSFTCPKCRTTYALHSRAYDADS